MIFYIAMAFISVILGVMVAYLSKNKLMTLSAVALTLILVGLYPVAYSDTLSKPRSVNDQIYNLEPSLILAYHIQYGETIYYLLAVPGVDEPRYFVEPWDAHSKQKAEKLQDEKNEGKLMYDKSLEGDDQVGNYQPKIPEQKDLPTLGGTDYVNPD